MNDHIVVVRSEIDRMREELRKNEKRTVRLEKRIQTMRAENTLLLARAILWKHAARDYRRRFYLMAKVSDSWYQGYRRAWKLDEVIRPRYDVFDYLGYWILNGIRRVYRTWNLITQERT